MGAVANFDKCQRFYMNKTGYTEESIITLDYVAEGAEAYIYKCESTDSFDAVPSTTGTYQLTYS